MAGKDNPTYVILAILVVPMYPSHVAQNLAEYRIISLVYFNFNNYVLTIRAAAKQIHSSDGCFHLAPLVLQS